MLIDDALVKVSTAKCDNHSMRLNFELNVLAHCPATARGLEAEFQDDFGKSQEITIEEFRRRPFVRRLIETLVRPLAPMI